MDLNFTVGSYKAASRFFDKFSDGFYSRYCNKTHGGLCTGLCSNFFNRNCNKTHGGFCTGFAKIFSADLAADSRTGFLPDFETDFTRFVFCKKCAVSVEVRIIKW